MDIVIFQSVHKQNHMNKDETGKSSKNRLGYKPVTMSQNVRITGLRNKINRAWKNDVIRKLKKFSPLIRKDVSCIVRTDFGVFTVVPRSPELFAKHLANLMLLEIKKDSKPLTDANNMKSILDIYKNRNKKSAKTKAK